MLEVEAGATEVPELRSGPWDGSARPQYRTFILVRVETSHSAEGPPLPYPGLLVTREQGKRAASGNDHSPGSSDTCGVSKGSYGVQALGSTLLKAGCQAVCPHEATQSRGNVQHWSAPGWCHL